MHVCLVMIVRDEEAIITRALRSAVPLISSWAIVDTGSIDATPALCEEILGHLPGGVFHREWTDFGTARTEAFQCASGFEPDYFLVLDADDWLEAPGGFTWPELTNDFYTLSIHHATMRHQRAQLFRASLPWRYVGVVHEYPAADGAQTSGHLAAPTYHCGQGLGARSQDPEKFARDAALLERALQAEPNNTRNQFYLAQSYRDAGALRQAEIAYRRRAALGGWTEEVYVSHLERGRALERLCDGPAEVRNAWLDAIAVHPDRPEAYLELARYSRLRGEWGLARFFAETASSRPQPPGALFAEMESQWRSHDELALAAYYTGDQRLARQLTQGLLDSYDLCPDTRQRLEANLVFYS